VLTFSFITIFWVTVWNGKEWLRTLGCISFANGPNHYNCSLKTSLLKDFLSNWQKIVDTTSKVPKKGLFALNFWSEHENWVHLVLKSSSSPPGATEKVLRWIDPAMNRPVINRFCDESTRNESDLWWINPSMNRPAMNRLCDESTHDESTYEKLTLR
jgi:hypothetical protein